MNHIGISFWSPSPTRHIKSDLRKQQPWLRCTLDNPAKLLMQSAPMPYPPVPFKSDNKKTTAKLEKRVEKISPIYFNGSHFVSFRARSSSNIFLSGYRSFISFFAQRTYRIYSGVVLSSAIYFFSLSPARCLLLFRRINLNMKYRHGEGSHISTHITSRSTHANRLSTVSGSAPHIYTLCSEKFSVNTSLQR